MRITREMLIQAMHPVNGRVPTLKEIGGQFGVTHQAIEQQLTKHELRKPSSTPPEAFCPTCGSYRAIVRGRRNPCRKCNPPKIYHLVCGEESCKKPFTLTQSEMTGRTRPHKLRPEGRKIPFLCSKSCHGRWFGHHHGGRGGKPKPKPEVLTQPRVAPGRIHPSWIQRHG